jgi:hypothetical protein
VLTVLKNEQAYKICKLAVFTEEYSEYSSASEGLTTAMVPDPGFLGELFTLRVYFQRYSGGLCNDD